MSSVRPIEVYMCDPVVGAEGRPHQVMSLCANTVTAILGANCEGDTTPGLPMLWEAR